MSRYQKFAMLMLMSAAPAFAIAQTPQPPPSTTDPSGASTPHQQKAMHDQMMKECMQKEHQKNSSMSKEQARKNCESQLKMPERPKE